MASLSRQSSSTVFCAWIVAGVVALGITATNAQLPAANKGDTGTEQEAAKAAKVGKQTEVSLSVRVLWSADGKEEPTAASDTRVQLRGDDALHRTDKNGIASMGKVAPGAARLLFFHPRANVCQLDFDVRPDMKQPVVLLTEKTCAPLPTP
jgi:hypothetical protein